MALGDYLTKQSNYLIDWNRVGNRIFTNHHYTTKEKLERGFVISSIAALGLLAWNQSAEGGLIPFALGASLGFLISHTVILSPLIYKRLVAQWSCNEIIKQINTKLSDEQPLFVSLVQSVCDQVMNSANSRSASEIWGRRQRLLTTLQEWLNDESIPREQLTEALNNTDIITLLDKKDMKFINNAEDSSNVQLR